MNNKRAFTMTELLAGIIIGCFLMLTMGVLVTRSNYHFHRIRNEMNVTNDILFSFKIIKNVVHAATTVSITSPGGAWVGDRVVIDNRTAFGLYEASGRRELVYLNDKDDETDREVMFYVDGTTASLTVSLSGKALLVHLSGEKGDVPFDMSTTVLRRS